MVTQDGELDLSLVEAWVGKLLQTKGTDLYRMHQGHAVRTPTPCASH